MFCRFAIFIAPALLLSACGGSPEPGDRHTGDFSEVAPLTREPRSVYELLYGEIPLDFEFPEAPREEREVSAIGGGSIVASNTGRLVFTIDALEKPQVGSAFEVSVNVLSYVGAPKLAYRTVCSPRLRLLKGEPSGEMPLAPGASYKLSFSLLSETIQDQVFTIHFEEETEEGYKLRSALLLKIEFQRAYGIYDGR
ncbi:MAG: hypothetical protein NUW37_17060 [Planctomycetes bacterium]|nr:hypothetical protein [Planctomycetota bacterium]